MKSKINKSIPMDSWMIDKIHEIMLEHMKSEGKSISFGEATRILLQVGLESHRQYTMLNTLTKSLYAIYGVK